MENKLIVAAHGNYAQGVKSAVELISNTHENILYLSMYLDNTVDDEREVEKALQTYCDKYNVIVLTDLSGGSVNRLFMSQLMKYPFHLISGFNLGIVLELSLQTDVITKEFLQDLVAQRQSAAMYCNELFDEF